MSDEELGRWFGALFAFAGQDDRLTALIEAIHLGETDPDSCMAVLDGLMRRYQPSRRSEVNGPYDWTEAGIPVLPGVRCRYRYYSIPPRH